MSLPLPYFQKLVESCPDIIVAVDRHGTIIFYNEGARSNLGFTREEIIGRSVLEVYPDLEEAKRVMAAIRAGDGGEKGKARNLETVFKTKNGERIQVAISASIIYDEEGREVGSIGFAKDIREIRRKNRLATLCEIAVGLSHEINNSLEVLVNQQELLRQYFDRVVSDEDYMVESERLDSVDRQIRKIQEITRRIADMAEQGSYGTKEYLGGKIMADLTIPNATPIDDHARAAGGLPLEGLRLLVVDDDLGVCQSLRDLLQQERCIVDVAPNAQRALELLGRKEFDLVLSDVVMPDLDGYELFKRVKKSHPNLPVVLMTAYFYDKDHVIKRSCLDGLKGVLYKKPIDPDRLKKIIQTHCFGEAPREEAR